MEWTMYDKQQYMKQRKQINYRGKQSSENFDFATTRCKQA